MRTKTKNFTEQEKKAYFAGLREQWTAAKKKYSESELGEARAFIAEHGLSISPYSFMFVQISMRAHGFSGIPYLDCKTYAGWQASGFQVRKGETSKIKGITWLGVGKSEKPDADEGDPAFLMPKEYHLFHRSQVEPLMAAALEAKQGRLL